MAFPFSPPEVGATLVGRSVRLSLQRPLIMGILNVTPDSFSDGGAWTTLDAVRRRAEVMANEGADLIDIGGESTRPGAALVSLQEELDRVLPVVELLHKESSLPLSIDTNKSAVASEALSLGADFVNDISGLNFDAAMATTVAAAGAGLFVMHTSGRPEEMQSKIVYDDLVAEVCASLQASLHQGLAAGIGPGQLAVDPGVGFGKSVEGNLELLRRLDEIAVLGYPVLLGTSRKSVIGAVLEQPQPVQRLHGSLTTVALGVASGARLFRVHDGAPSREVADMAWAVVNGDRHGRL